MQRVLVLFVLLVSGIDGMTSGLICPCECAMVISTCDCATAVQVKKEITQMKESGFSEEQVFSALRAEYGKEIQAHPEKESSMSLWMGGISLSIILAFLGYILARKPKTDVIPDMKKYELRFKEEYQKFVCGADEPDEITEPFSKDPAGMKHEEKEDKECQHQ